MLSALAAAAGGAFIASRAAHRAPQLALPVAGAGILCMNRILVEPGECIVERNGQRSASDDGELVVALGPEDRRTKHVREVLRAEDGTRVRVGVLDAGTTDGAKVQWVPAAEDSSQTAEGQPSLRLQLGPASTLLQPLEEAARPRVDLLLSMPRPLQFARLLPVVASLGVGTMCVNPNRIGDPRQLGPTWSTISWDQPGD